jgi:transposase-like protein
VLRWRVDETFIQTRPKMGYLYRAVDKDGKTVDSLFQVGAELRRRWLSSARRWHHAHPDGRAR